VKRFVIAAATATSFALVPPAIANDCSDGEIVIKFSLAVAAQGHPKGEMASALADRVNEAMDGKACMQVYPSSSLFDDGKVMEALLLGHAQLAAPPLSRLESYTLKYRVFDLPFLFTDMDAVTTFTRGEEGQKLLGAMSDYGFAGLGYVFGGLKQLSANKPLLVPSDAKGLKFSVETSDVTAAMIEAIGASAQSLAAKDVYDALQTRFVDGQANTWSNIYGRKLFKVQDGTTETNHQLQIYVAVTSKEWLDSLDDDMRDQFLEIFADVADAHNARSIGVNDADKRNIIKNGSAVRSLTPEQRNEWVETMKPVWSKFGDDIGQDVIDAAVAANKAR